MNEISIYKKTIQAAVDIALDHEIIFVKSGTYKKNVVINRKISLYGNNFDCKSTEDVRKPETIIMPSVHKVGMDDGQTMISLESSDVVVKGVMVDGDNPELEGVYNAAYGINASSYVDENLNQVLIIIL